MVAFISSEVFDTSQLLGFPPFLAGMTRIVDFWAYNLLFLLCLRLLYSSSDMKACKDED